HSLVGVTVWVPRLSIFARLGRTTPANGSAGAPASGGTSSSGVAWTGSRGEDVIVVRPFPVTWSPHTPPIGSSVKSAFHVTVSVPVSVSVNWQASIGWSWVSAQIIRLPLRLPYSSISLVWSVSHWRRDSRIASLTASAKLLRTLPRGVRGFVASP